MVEYSTIEPWQMVDENGVVYEQGSLMAYFQDVLDVRKARGKRYSLVTLLRKVASSISIPLTLLVLDRSTQTDKRPGILVVTAGTADLPVAEEAAMTAELMGNAVERLFDVGVAGIHRLLSQADRLWQARVIVVVAGMDGALPSVVGGLVSAPVIAVPTSVGYGASFNGLAALLTMLNSCATGVGVVNIDNGFGAGVLANNINRLAHAPDSKVS